MQRALAGVVLARMAVNGGIRVVYPFLPVIADGLGVSLQVVAMLVASRSLAGLAAPWIARLVSSYHHRTLMLTSQVLVVTGCLMIAASQAAPTPIRTAVAAAGFVATGLARPLFDLPMQAWVSAHVPPTSRGRALGVTELGWSLSLVATVPAAGVLIGRFGWHSPFLLVAGLAAAGALALMIALRRETLSVPDVPAPAHMSMMTRRVPAGLAICVGALLAVAAGESLLVMYGEWLAQDFGMSVAQIGASTVLVVAAELAGEGFVVAASDRLGLCRSLFTGLLLSATAYVALGLIGGHMWLAVAAIALLFVAFEVTVVVLIAFASTVMSTAAEGVRLLGGLMVAVACGNAIGAVLAPPIFSRGGIGLLGTASAGAVMAAAAVLWLGSRPVPKVAAPYVGA
ncbi:MAG: MFS transporter [Egibacteraceae bacterium]